MFGIDRLPGNNSIVVTASDLGEVILNVRRIMNFLISTYTESENYRETIIQLPCGGISAYDFIKKYATQKEIESFNRDVEYNIRGIQQNLDIQTRNIIQ